ncbi:MAG: helix-turn-helix domain-containing protein [Draconibacterium sp.]|jgi:excisionase family DNA binding protein|nr:DNA-binding protein [Prolixibacteraceae bacterium]
MSSTIQVQKICEFCGKEFTAQTTVTRFCGHGCASRSYKQRKKENKIGWAVEETNRQKVFAASDIQIEVIQQKDFLSIKEAYTLLGISERTFFRLLKTGTIPAARLGGRTIIKRSIIDKLFAL